MRHVFSLVGWESSLRPVGRCWERAMLVKTRWGWGVGVRQVENAANKHGGAAVAVTLGPGCK